MQRQDGCCSKEVANKKCCLALKVLTVDCAGTLGVFKLVDILADNGWDLGEEWFPQALLDPKRGCMLPGDCWYT